MPTSMIEPRLKDDASGVAWFQKGATLLEGRKQDREFEEKLRRRMKHSVMQELQFWVGMAWVMFLFFGTDKTFGFLATVSAVVAFACAIDGAAAKRALAILEWIEYQKAKGKPAGVDSLPSAS